MEKPEHIKITARIQKKANFSSLFFLLFILALGMWTAIGLLVSLGIYEQPLVTAGVELVQAQTQNPQISSPAALAVPKNIDDLAQNLHTKAAIVTPSLSVKKIPQAHLKIARIGVNAVIKDMGLTSAGAMALPDNPVDVGWYGLGTRPGDIGSAVIGGHNSWDSGAGVFAHLDKLQKGDVLSVIDAAGVSISFVVREMRTYDATDTNSGIFQSQSGIHLNLITCSGSWNPATKSYTTRLVVFTDAI